MVPDSLLALAEDIVARYRNKDHMVALTETSLGGLCTAILTTIPGASSLLEKALVPYANEAKIADLGISTHLIETHGAVSAEVALQLAEQTLGLCERASMAFAETGISGPGGGSPEKPVGTVYLAKAIRGATPAEVRHFHFTGDRRSVRVQAAAALLTWMLDAVEG